jgi:hypothetical protein
VGLRILQDEKITAAGGVPSMVWQMMEHRGYTSLLLDVESLL